MLLVLVQCSSNSPQVKVYLLKIYFMCLDKPKTYSPWPKLQVLETLLSPLLMINVLLKLLLQHPIKLCSSEFLKTEIYSLWALELILLLIGKTHLCVGKWSGEPDQVSHRGQPCYSSGRNRTGASSLSAPDFAQPWYDIIHVDDPKCVIFYRESEEAVVEGDAFVIAPVIPPPQEIHIHSNLDWV
jgi:hypothetical protein